MKPDSRKSITQLDFERRTLKAQLDMGDNGEVEAQRLIEAIDNLDLLIAATPAKGLPDLR